MVSSDPWSVICLAKGALLLDGIDDITRAHLLEKCNVCIYLTPLGGMACSDIIRGSEPLNTSLAFFQVLWDNSYLGVTFKLAVHCCVALMFG